MKWLLMEELYDNTDFKNRLRSEYKVFTITNLDEIRRLCKVLYPMYEESYKDKGGFMSATDERSLRKTTKLINIVYDHNDQTKDILAFSCYRTTYIDDLKSKGHSGNPFFKNQDKVKDAVQRIILHEIDSIGIHYWTEVSQPIEHYFKKLDGFPIPNIFAQKILETVGKEIELSSDDFHYSRKIDDDDIVKCMFGFQSKDVFDDIIANIGKMTPYSSYDEFRKKANSEEMYESAKIENRHSFASKLPKQVCVAITIIEYLWEFYEMGKLPILTDIQRKDLSRSIEVLKCHNTGKFKIANDTRIEMANELLLMLPTLVLHKI